MMKQLFSDWHHVHGCCPWIVNWQRWSKSHFQVYGYIIVIGFESWLIIVLVLSTGYSWLCHVVLGCPQPANCHRSNSMQAQLVPWPIQICVTRCEEKKFYHQYLPFCPVQTLKSIPLWRTFWLYHDKWLFQIHSFQSLWLCWQSQVDTNNIKTSNVLLKEKDFKQCIIDSSNMIGQPTNLIGNTQWCRVLLHQKFYSQQNCFCYCYASTGFSLVFAVVVNFIVFDDR